MKLNYQAEAKLCTPPPATMSMKALEDSRVLGIQINQAGTEN